MAKKSLSSLISEAHSSRRAARSAQQSLLEDAEQQQPGIGESLVEAGTGAFMGLLNAIDYIDASTRAAINQGRVVFGNEPIAGEGRETIFGRAPSGTQIFETITGADLGPNQVGKAEWRDVPGFLTEVAASPLNVIGLGATTKVGTEAARAARLADRALVAARRGTKAGRLVRRQNLKALREMGYTGTAKEVLTKASEALRPSLREQALAGQRSLISLDIPGVVNLPLVRGAAPLGALGATGRGIAKIAEPLTRRMLPGGRIAAASLKRIEDPVERARVARTFGESVTQGQGTERLTRFEGEQLADFAEQYALADAGEAANALKSIEVKTANEVANVHRVADKTWDKRINNALKKGKVEKAARLEILKQRQINQALVPRGSKSALLDLSFYAAEKIDTAGQIREAVITKKLQLDELADNLRKAADVKDQEVIYGYRNAPSNGRSFRQNAEDGIARREHNFALWSDDMMSKAKIADVVVQELPPHIRHMADTIRAAQGKLLSSEITEGVAVSPLKDVMLQYMHRAVTNEARTLINKSNLPMHHPLRQLVRQFETKGGFTESRVSLFQGVSVPVLNDWIRQMLAKEGIDFAGDFFNPSVAESITRRFAQGGRARAGASVWSTTAQLYALPLHKAGRDAVPIEKFLRDSQLGSLMPDPITGQRRIKWERTGSDEQLKAIKAAIEGTPLQDMYIPADIANATKLASTTLDDPREIHGLLRIADRINSMYRGAVTVLFPGYHVRNEIGNFSLMTVGGMRPDEIVEFVGKAASVQANQKAIFELEHGIKVPGIIPGLLPVEKRYKELYRAAVEHGALGSGRFAEVGKLSELAQQGGRGPIKRISNLKKLGEKKLYNPMMRSGIAMENNAKLAMFMWAVEKKGMSYSEAGELVRKHLFDYQDLSQFEKKYLRRWAFFYTFQRKAIPLLAETSVKRPQVPRLYGYATGEVGTRRQERENLPPWVRNRIPIGLGDNRFLNLGIPFEELSNYSTEGKGPARLLQKVLSQAAPVPRLGLELATGTDLRTGRPLRKTFDPAQTRTGLAAAGVPDNVAAQLAMPVSVINRLGPHSRFVSTLSRLADTEATGGSLKTQDVVGSVFGGGSMTRIDPVIAPLTQRLRATGESIRRLQDMGETSETSQKLKALRRLQGQLRRRIQKLSP